MKTVESLPSKPIRIPIGSDPKGPEYFRFVNGEPASRNKISEQHPYLIIAAEAMITHGDAIGQKEFVPQDDGGVIFDVRLQRVQGVNHNDRT